MVRNEQKSNISLVFKATNNYLVDYDEALVHGLSGSGRGVGGVKLDIWRSHFEVCYQNEKFPFKMKKSKEGNEMSIFCHCTL